MINMYHKVFVPACGVMHMPATFLTSALNRESHSLAGEYIKNVTITGGNTSV